MIPWELRKEKLMSNSNYDNSQVLMSMSEAQEKPLSTNYPCDPLTSVSLCN